MRFKIVTSIFIFIVCSCQTNSNYSGSAATRLGINPLPTSKEWVYYTKRIKKSYDNSGKPAILWKVGSYSKDGVIFNYDGRDNSAGKIYHSDFDYNKEFFEYFQSKGITIFLLVEPGDSSIITIIDDLFNKYSKYSVIKGICLDMDWYNNDEVSIDNIYYWSLRLKEKNSQYKLLLKSWDINKIDHFYNDDIIYINSIRRVKSEKDILRRAYVWYKKYYPSEVGFEVGFKDDNHIWSNYYISDFVDDIRINSIEFDYIFWSDSNLEMVK